MMRSDLQQIKLPNKEVKQLSGVNVNAVFRPITAWRVFSVRIQHLALVILSWALLVFAIQATGWTSYVTILTLTLALFLTIRAITVYKRIRFSRNNRVFVNLLEDIDQYNKLVQAVYISDQLESVGNRAIGNNRGQVIEALELTRSDLIRAIKTERVLRENQGLINQNPELFQNNLTALTSLQIYDEASERGRILKEALQIALSTKQEMDKLREQ